MLAQNLKQFLLTKMRMSHVYQPVMIRYLLANDGVADDLSIAKEISQQDPSQVEYYKKITNNMVGQVLRKNNIVEKAGSQYVLKDFSELSHEDIHLLIKICTSNLTNTLTKGAAAFGRIG